MSQASGETVECLYADVAGEHGCALRATADSPPPERVQFREAVLTNMALRELVRELVDDDDCWYDHHGYCQAHSLHEKPCPHERAKALLGGKT